MQLFFKEFLNQRKKSMKRKRGSDDKDEFSNKKNMKEKNRALPTYWYFETKRYLGFFLPADFAENLTADSVWHKTATL